MQNSQDSAGSSDSECPVCELIPPALLQAIPVEFKRIRFEDLKDGEDYSQNFVLGKVFQAFPISKRAKGYFRKLLLTEAAEKQDEETTEKKLNMFILNENEKQLDSIDQKSFVAVSGFKVENLTCKSGDEDSILPVQVLVVVQADSSESTMIWIATSVASQLDDSTSSPCQDLNDEGMECEDPQPDSGSESMVSDDPQEEHSVARLITPSANHQHSPVPTDDSDDIDIESDESCCLQDAVKISTHQNNVEQANPVPESSGRRYTYTQLGELKESITPDQNFNIYAIVANCYFKPSSPDRDKILELILQDSTVDFFRCRVIGRCTDKFPDIYPGDVIRIHRMLVDKYRDKFKGRCFSPKFIVVFDGKTDDIHPRCVAKTFVFTQDDKKMVQNLRLLARKEQDIKLISEIKMDDFVTVICQVVSICMVRNESVLLKVWDGTSSVILMDDRTKSYMCGKIDERLFKVAKDYLVPIWINGDYTIAAAELKPGQYVKVCDVHMYAPKSKPDEPRLCIHPQTKSGRGVEVLDPKDDLVQEIKSRLQKVWEDAGVMEEITMDSTPSFMKNVDISNIDCGTNTENVPQDNAASTVVRKDENSGEDVNVQQDIAASQAVSAAALASQQSLISTLNQGIEPASSMQLTLGSPAPVNDQLSSQKNVENITVDGGLFSPSVSRSLSPAKERGKRTNPDSNIDNASKKRKVDDGDDHNGAVSEEPPEFPSKDSVPNPSVSGNGTSDLLPSQVDSESQPASSSSPLSSHRSQPNWWKSVETISVSVGHQNIEPTYLDNVVKHFVPYKFRLFVTVMNVEPQTDSIVKLIRLYCPKCRYLSEDGRPDLEVYQIRNKIPLYLCATCSSEESGEDDKCQKQILEYTFVTSFTLSDGTSSIEAYIWRKNAVMFFQGIKPEDALADSSKADTVHQMLWDICPNCCPFESTSRPSQNKNGSYYPVLDCCIMSYTAASKTRYQIFDTRLKY